MSGCAPELRAPNKGLGLLPSCRRIAARLRNLVAGDIAIVEPKNVNELKEYVEIYEDEMIDMNDSNKDVEIYEDEMINVNDSDNSDSQTDPLIKASG